MKIKALADKDVTKIHQATLTVLEQTGVKFPSEKALHIFAEAGAEVDLKTIDEIMAVGPDGHFLYRDFTVRNVRRLWQPRISPNGLRKCRIFVTLRRQPWIRPSGY